jgi:hypothetical protein
MRKSKKERKAINPWIPFSVIQEGIAYTNKNSIQQKRIDFDFHLDVIEKVNAMNFDDWMTIEAYECLYDEMAKSTDITDQQWILETIMKRIEERKDLPMSHQKQMTLDFWRVVTSLIEQFDPIESGYASPKDYYGPPKNMFRTVCEVYEYRYGDIAKKDERFFDVDLYKQFMEEYDSTMFTMWETA